jgi:hypothetical protein
VESAAPARPVAHEPVSNRRCSTSCVDLEKCIRRISRPTSAAGVSSMPGAAIPRRPRRPSSSFTIGG